MGRPATLVFLGTGASGGTPGDGRSGRMESSLLVRAEQNILLDVTRDFAAQSAAIGRIDIVLLTHAHRDASGGFAILRQWARRGPSRSLPVVAHPATLDRLRERYRRHEPLELVAFPPGDSLVLGDWTITAAEVPHARDASRFPTLAWRLERGGRVLVYASDVAALTPALAALADGATVLVLDGAMWGRSLFAHLRGERALPEVCRWRVERILLTQIGRSAPPHETLRPVVRKLCARARPAYDELVEPL